MFPFPVIGDRGGNSFAHKVREKEGRRISPHGKRGKVSGIWNKTTDCSEMRHLSALIIFGASRTCNLNKHWYEYWPLINGRRQSGQGKEGPGLVRCLDMSNISSCIGK